MAEHGPRYCATPRASRLDCSTHCVRSLCQPQVVHVPLKQGRLCHTLVTLLSPLLKQMLLLPLNTLHASVYAGHCAGSDAFDMHVWALGQYLHGVHSWPPAHVVVAALVVASQKRKLHSVVLPTVLQTSTKPGQIEVFAIKLELIHLPLLMQ